MANLNFSSTLPAAPTGSTNVAFNVDSNNNISASIATPATLATANTFTAVNTFSSDVSVAGGSLSVRGLGTLTAPTVTPTGTAGTTKYSYAVVAVQADGSTTAASTTGFTSTGNATLSATNYNALSWTAVTNAVSYNVYRLTSPGTSPTTTGKIASGLTGTTLSDTGLAGDGTTAPQTNQTGLVSSATLGGNFGGWTSFSPTLTPSGSMTITAQAFTTAQYLQVGPMVFLNLYGTFTIGGTASNVLTLNAPIAGVGNNSMLLLNMGVNSAYSPACCFMIPGSPTTIQLLLPATANYVSGSAYGFCCAGSYRCA